MTNEEIERCATESLRALVSQAYEEAARVAEKHADECAEGYEKASETEFEESAYHGMNTARELAASIRALKDSLVPESVSS
jgi:flagellar biosynthesis/type III secretory pathway protein FliH